MCLRKSRSAAPSPAQSTSRRAWSRHDRRDLTEAGRRRGLLAGERRLQVGEQPRPPEAAAADDHAVAASGGHHARARRPPPRCRRCRARAPSSPPPSAGRWRPSRLGRSTAARRCGRAARSAATPSSSPIRPVSRNVSVRSSTPMRNFIVTGTPSGAAAATQRTDDGAQQRPASPGTRGTTAAPGHLRRRAAEVEIDVVDPTLADQPPHRLAQHGSGRCRRAAGCGAARRARRSPSAPSWRSPRSAPGP